MKDAFLRAIGARLAPNMCPDCGAVNGPILLRSPFCETQGIFDTISFRGECVLCHASIPVKARFLRLQLACMLLTSAETEIWFTRRLQRDWHLLIQPTIVPDRCPVGQEFGALLKQTLAIIEGGPADWSAQGSDGWQDFLRHDERGEGTESIT